MFDFKVIALFAIVVASLVSGFFVYYKTTEAEKALLIANNAKLEVAAKIQDNTIIALKAKAELLSITNAKLTKNLSLAESEAASERKAIDDFDPDTLSTEELEKRINEDYNRTSRLIDPDGLGIMYNSTKATGNK